MPGEGSNGYGLLSRVPYILECMNGPAHRHTLGLQPSLMTMETYISANRSWRSPVPFLDFTIDGESLIATILGEGPDRMPTRLQPEWEQASVDEQIKRLSALGEPDYEDGRTAMYICRCGDLDCPGIAARITRSAETVTWSDWAWKDGLNLSDPIAELGSYTFTIAEYERTLADATERLSRIPDWMPPAWDPPKQKCCGHGHGNGGGDCRGRKRS